MTSPLVTGALLIIVSEALLVAMSAAIKIVSVELPNEMLVFFRNVFGLVALSPLLIRAGPSALRTRRLHLHLLRALSGVGAMYCFFYTIASIPLAQAVLFKLTAPFFIPIIALLWLGERLPWSARIAILVGFVGVALILRPGFGGLHHAALFGLLGAALGALAKVAIRRMGETEPPRRIVFYFGTVATLVSAVPLVWAWQTPSLEALGWLGMMGCCATAAQLCLTRAYSLAPAGQIGPFTYISVVFASLLGWLFWNEIPATMTFAGSALVIVAGLLTLRGRGQAVPARRPSEEPEHHAG